MSTSIYLTSAPLASSDANAANAQKILADLSKSDDDASSLNYSVATDNNEESGGLAAGGATAAGLANVVFDPLEDDVVLTHKKLSTSRKLLTSRPAFLVALLKILIIGLSVGLSNRNNGPTSTGGGGSGPDIEVKAATAAAVPKKDANNKKDGNKVPVPSPISGTPVPNDFSTPFPTNQGTETVGIDATFGPTPTYRGEDWRRKNKNRRVNVIQSPTWHG